MKARYLSLTLSGLVLAFGIGCLPPIEEKPSEPPPPKLEEPKVAEAGVGKQGQSLQNESGVGRMIAQPAITLFAVKQRVVFEIQIPQAVNLYQASEGKFPATHDEFMTKIIKANQINLPELPAGQEYKYHPEDHQLWVHPIGQ